MGLKLANIRRWLTLIYHLTVAIPSIDVIDPMIVCGTTNKEIELISSKTFLGVVF